MFVLSIKKNNGKFAKNSYILQNFHAVHAITLPPSIDTTLTLLPSIDFFVSQI